MVTCGGIICCLSAAALYVLGRSSSREAEVLRSVARVSQLTELAKLLDTESEALPLVVAISGRVGSDNPINSEYSGLRGVIVEQTAEQHFLKYNDTGSWIHDLALMPHFLKGSWTHDSALMPSMITEVPWYLAVKDFFGAVRIHRPPKGPFYVSPETIDELIVQLGERARWYKYASLGLTVFGAFLIAKHYSVSMIEGVIGNCVVGLLLLLLSSGQDKEGSNGNAENGSDSGNSDRSIPDLCVICFEQEYNAVFLPCGHMCCCTTCCSQLSNCPLCRGQIEQVVKVYRH